MLPRRYTRIDRLKGCDVLSQAISTSTQSAIPNIPIFDVIIHPAPEIGGYWAECDMPNGGCSTQGVTLQETQINMYEAMDLFLEDDHPDVTGYILRFELKDA